MNENIQTNEEIIPEGQTIEANGQEKLLKNFNLKKSKNNLVLGIVAGVLGTITIVALIYYFAIFKTNQNSAETSLIVNAPPDSEIVSDSNSNALEEMDGEISYELVWEREPVELSTLSILDMGKVNAQEYRELLPEGYQPTYFRMAKFSTGEDLIYAKIPSEGMGVWQMFVPLIADDNNISIIENYVDEWSLNFLKKYLKPEISLVQKDIADVELPDSFEYNGLNFDVGSLAYKENITFHGNVDWKPVSFAKTKYGEIFLSYYKVADTIAYTRDSHLKAVDSRWASILVKAPFITDDNYVVINLDSDETKSGTFSDGSFRGCGGNPGVTIIRQGSEILNDKKKIGTSGGEDIYILTSANNGLHQLLYSDYQVGRMEDDLLSFDEFMSKEPYFLWQDGIGDWRVYFNTEFQPMAECGKPVIYLYPESEINVKLKVGAKITKSDPPYPIDGWQVKATPEGLIEYKNATYESLFWEGIGSGLYPVLNQTGVVVKNEMVENTLYKQMGQLGLNAKEANDFMDFWRDKFPNSPFVRLTWLLTEDMDKLAPLSVWPKPNSKIRVFLEFEGLEEYKLLKPQELKSSNRIGFTLVEWGGLLVK